MNNLNLQVVVFWLCNAISLIYNNLHFQRGLIQIRLPQYWIKPMFSDKHGLWFLPCNLKINRHTLIGFWSYAASGLWRLFYVILCDFIVARSNGQRFERKPCNWVNWNIAAYCTRLSLCEIQIECVFLCEDTNCIDCMYIVTKFTDLVIICIRAALMLCSVWFVTIWAWRHLEGFWCLNVSRISMMRSGFSHRCPLNLEKCDACNLKQDAI